MLEVVHAGQAGKTALLFDMHRFRKRVFKDQMGWDVCIDENELEVDEFDLPEAIYLLALDANRNVVGNMRLLPSNGPTMVRDIWPQFMEHITMPSDPLIWEISRFAVDTSEGKTARGLAQVNKITQRLFCGLIELCLLCGVKKVVALYDVKIAQIHHWLDCEPEVVTPPLPINGCAAQVGIFRTDHAALRRLRKAADINRNFITRGHLPPLLQNLGQGENA